MFGLIRVGNPVADEVGEDSQCLAEGGTQRTRLIGFARNLPAIEVTKEVGVRFAAGLVKARAGGV
jgi:hypothetical protein